MNERMMHLYSALLCIAVHPKRFTIMCVGGGGQDTGVTPLLYTRSAMRFLMTTESQDLGLTSHLKDEMGECVGKNIIVPPKCPSPLSKICASFLDHNLNDAPKISK